MDFHSSPVSGASDLSMNPSSGSDPSPTTLLDLADAPWMMMSRDDGSDSNSL